MSKIADAIGFVLPYRYVLEVSYPDGSVEYEFFPSELRVRMRQAELMGETSDLFKHDKLLVPVKVGDPDQGNLDTGNVKRKPGRPSRA